jgi:hypothetical protein
MNRSCASGGAQTLPAGVPTPAASRSASPPERLAPPLCVLLPVEVRRLRTIGGRTRDAALEALFVSIAAAPENDQAWAREMLCEYLPLPRRVFDVALAAAQKQTGAPDSLQRLVAAYLEDGAPAGRALRRWLSAQGFPDAPEKLVRELRFAARIRRGASVQASAQAPEAEAK